MYPFTPGWREVIIVKCLAQGQKCHDSWAHTLLNRNTRAWVWCSYLLGHDTPTSAFYNNCINVLVIGLTTFLQSVSAPWGVYSPELPWRSQGFFIHNINLYPRRYSFTPLSEEKQYYSKVSCSRTQVSRPGFKPTLLWISTRTWIRCS